MARKDWREKRVRQGFSYTEVREEMERRVRGEYRFDKKETAQRFANGLKRLDRAYRLSAHLHNFLEKEKMTYEDLIAIMGTGDNDASIELMLDPVGRPEKNYSLQGDYFMHCFYPGDDIPCD